ncbi:MAG TPA: HlyD family type I secretion periplasmic adaptor subunit [Rhodospirillales bacterium]|nr:HlyD family type I secretion periplasmic adaptor subunit [Rhodospirillales bacterium]
MTSHLPRTTGATTHLFLVLLVVSCLAFGAWATIGTLDIVSLANGEVIPSSQIKKVQHLEGGIVREISVSEGQVVERNQQLLVLEPIRSNADVAELGVRLRSLRAEIARLEAEARGRKKPVFPADLTANAPLLVRQTLELFDSRKRSMQGRIDSQKETIIQKRQDEREINARIRNQQDSLELMAEQIAISEELLKEELTNRYVHLDLLKEASRLKGQHEQDVAALVRAKSAIKEAQTQLKSIYNLFAEEAGTALETSRLEFNELSQRERKYRDSLDRTVVRSPVAGIVKTLYISTIGGVLKAGDTIVEIVPTGDKLVIEARLPTQDIGYVQVGQSALVKLASADARRFGGLEGTVVQVSPDTLVTRDGVPYYRVRIETGKDRFLRGAEQYQLFPGMQVVASIRTGERTVAEYLAGPFLGTLNGALKER